MNHVKCAYMGTTLHGIEVKVGADDWKYTNY